MKRIFLLSFLAALWVIAAPASAQSRTARAARVQPAPPAAAPCLQFYLNRLPPVATTPPPSDERRFCHSFYAIAYSTTRRNPVWTSYLLTRSMVLGSDGFDRNDRTFAQQVGLDRSMQGHNDFDYQRTRLALGHMTPDNDAGTLETQADTYWVTNIVPQNGGLNSGLWLTLETAVHELARREHEVYIVTGPLYLEPRDPVNGIAVPSHIFKAIYVPSARIALAFVAKNTFPTVCTIYSVRDFQQLAGLDVFPALPAPTTSRLPALPRGWRGFPRGCRPSRH